MRRFCHLAGGVDLSNGCSQHTFIFPRQCEETGGGGGEGEGQGQGGWVGGGGGGEHNLFVLLNNCN